MLAPKGDVVKALLQIGEVVPAAGPIPGEALDLIAEQFGVQLEKVAAEPLVQPFKPAVTVPEDDEASLRSRPRLSR